MIARPRSALMRTHARERANVAPSAAAIGNGMRRIRQASSSLDSKRSRCANRAGISLARRSSSHLQLVSFPDALRHAARASKLTRAPFLPSFRAAGTAAVRAPHVVRDALRSPSSARSALVGHARRDTSRSRVDTSSHCALAVRAAIRWRDDSVESAHADPFSARPSSDDTIPSATVVAR